MPNLVFEIVPGIHTLVSYQGTSNPTDAEWDAWLTTAQNAMKAPGPWRALVVTEGGHPSKAQQARLAHMMNGRSAPTAVISSAAVLRFVVTVLTFANRGLKCFSPAQTEEAFRHIGLPREQYTIARDVIQRLRRTLTKDGPRAECT